MDNPTIIKGAKMSLAALLAISISLLIPLKSALAVEDAPEQLTDFGLEVLSPEEMSELDAVENELVVMYEDGALDVSELNAGTSDDVEVVEKETLVEDAPDGEAVDVVTVSDDTDIDAAIEELTENPKVSSVEPNYIFSRFEDAPGESTAANGVVSDPDAPAADDVASDPDASASGDEPVADAPSVGSAQSFEDAAQEAEPADVQQLATSTNDPNLGSQYYLNSAGFRAAWDRIKCSGSVTVAVIDDGCFYDHPDLRANVDVANAYDALRKTSLQSAPSATNSNSHGTAVCGTIAAVANNGSQIAGASYNAKVLPINVFSSNGTAAYSTIMEALSYLERLARAKTVPGLKVLNMSFGAYAENEIAIAMRASLERLRYTYGILPVSAGGNGDEWTKQPILQKSYPADYDVCVSVTSLTQAGANSTWCDYNEYKDIAAPGEGILTTANNGGLASVSGTSFSSPLVASAAALVFAANPRLSATQVENALKQTATAVTGNARPQSGSKGALNVKAAVDLALGGGFVSNTPMARYTVMHRMYNPNSGEHFYTASAYERDALVRAGWRFEGSGWNAPLAGDPVYRMYNPNAGDHHYTPSVGERDSLVRAGWRYEGVGWYTSVAESQPLYRLYNPNAAAGAHHYTLSAGEATHLTFVGWRYEGIGWFGTD